MIPYSACLSFGSRRDARRWVILHDELSPYPPKKRREQRKKKKKKIRLESFREKNCFLTSPRNFEPI
uniref:Uncharacterized protein n=1 Tax=Vespula pensylvanica TaxID=30213 RepID=A0A834P0T3_VESPE|nr:hypothetical protein H0235_008929 [Vespula pensylvanica]